ncbi:MAG: hypothetical protein WDN69_27920 [Aliidongia sp.]
MSTTGTASSCSINYLSAFMDTRALHWQDLINYGAAFDMTAALINRISPFGTYETRHLLNGADRHSGPGRRVEGRALSGRAARRAVRCGAAGDDPELLRPDVQQSEGHTLRGRQYLGALLPVPDRRRPAAAAGLAGAEARHRDRHVARRAGRRLLLLAYAGLAGVAFCLWRGIETRSATTALAEGWTGIWRAFLPMLAIAYPVMLPVLALGTAGPDRPSALGAGDLQPRDLPVQHAVRRAVLPGDRFALGISADAYRSWRCPS